ncbi:MAG: class I SAM-dependent methyltransferase [Chloroflexota bacterium]
MLRNVYSSLETHAPSWIKDLVSVETRIKLGAWIKGSKPHAQPYDPDLLARLLVDAGYDPNAFLQLPVSLPAGHTIGSLTAEIEKFKIRNSPDIRSDNLNDEEYDGLCQSYLSLHLKRYLYTLELLPKNTAGKLLEIGPSPYQFSLLVDKYTKYEASYVDYFDFLPSDTGTAQMVSDDGEVINFPFHNLNIETDELPLKDGSFDCVALCEVIEHLTDDPLGVVLKLKRLLKPGGLFVLTTPNVASLSHTNNLLHGQNIYHAYSGFGIYDRHNREYTPRELVKLLEHAGFEVEQVKTSNITATNAADFAHWSAQAGALQSRITDLGDFSFISAVNSGPAKSKKPRWLYDNLPESELE